MDNEIKMSSWSAEEDAVLTQIVLDEVRKGKSQIMAFKRASRELHRTVQACSFRFYETIRPNFIVELNQAKKEAKFKAREIPSIKVEETPAERKEELLKWEKLLAERESRLHKQDEVKLVELKTEKDVESFLDALDKSTPLKDNPVIPSHYHKGGIDVIGFLEEHFGKAESYSVAEGFYIGNIIKYVSRYKQKNGTEDLEKALYYLDRLKQQGE